MLLNMFQGSKIINEFSNTEVNKWYEYNSIHTREENYLNVLSDQEKFKLLEWMKNNKLQHEPENAIDSGCYCYIFTMVMLFLFNHKVN